MRPHRGCEGCSLHHRTCCCSISGLSLPLLQQNSFESRDQRAPAVGFAFFGRRPLSVAYWLAARASVSTSVTCSSLWQSGHIHGRHAVSRIWVRGGGREISSRPFNHTSRHHARRQSIPVLKAGDDRAASAVTSTGLADLKGRKYMPENLTALTPKQEQLFLKLLGSSGRISRLERLVKLGYMLGLDVASVVEKSGWEGKWMEEEVPLNHLNELFEKGDPVKRYFKEIAELLEPGYREKKKTDKPATSRGFGASSAASGSSAEGAGSGGKGRGRKKKGKRTMKSTWELAQELREKELSRMLDAKEKEWAALMEERIRKAEEEARRQDAIIKRKQEDFTAGWPEDLKTEFLAALPYWDTAREMCLLGIYDFFEAAYYGDGSMDLCVWLLAAIRAVNSLSAFIYLNNLSEEPGSMLGAFKRLVAAKALVAVQRSVGLPVTGPWADGQEPEMMDPVKGNPVTDSIQVDFPPEDGYLTTSQQIQRLLNAGFPKFAKLVEASLRRRDAQRAAQQAESALAENGAAAEVSDMDARDAEVSDSDTSGADVSYDDVETTTMTWKVDMVAFPEDLLESGAMPPAACASSSAAVEGQHEIEESISGSDAESEAAAQTAADGDREAAEQNGAAPLEDRGPDLNGAAPMPPEQGSASAIDEPGAPMVQAAPDQAIDSASDVADEAAPPEQAPIEMAAFYGGVPSTVEEAADVAALDATSALEEDAAAASRSADSLAAQEDSTADPLAQEGVAGTSLQESRADTSEEDSSLQESRADTSEEDSSLQESRADTSEEDSVPGTLPDNSSALEQDGVSASLEKAQPGDEGLLEKPHLRSGSADADTGTTTAMKHHTRSRKAPRQRQSAVGWSSLPKVDEVDASGEIQEGISPTGVSDRDGVDVAWAQTADAADIRREVQLEADSSLAASGQATTSEEPTTVQVKTSGQPAGGQLQKEQQQQEKREQQRHEKRELQEDEKKDHDKKRAVSWFMRPRVSGTDKRNPIVNLINNQIEGTYISTQLLPHDKRCWKAAGVLVYTFDRDCFLRLLLGRIDAGDDQTYATWLRHGGWWILGGKRDATDCSAEATAVREMTEETAGILSGYSVMSSDLDDVLWYPNGGYAVYPYLLKGMPDVPDSYNRMKRASRGRVKGRRRLSTGPRPMLELDWVGLRDITDGRHQLHWVLEDMLRRTPLLPYLQQLEKLSLEKHHQEQRKWAKRPIRELSE